MDKMIVPTQKSLVRFIYFFKKDIIYSFEREKEHEQGEGLRERDKQTLC